MFADDSDFVTSRVNGKQARPNRKHVGPARHFVNYSSDGEQTTLVMNPIYGQLNVALPFILLMMRT